MGKVIQFVTIWRESGFFVAVVLTLKYLLKLDLNTGETTRLIRKAQVWGFSSECLNKNQEYRKANLKSKKRPETIHWILPRLSAGSGGHRTATRMMNHLAANGFKVTVWIQDPRKEEIPKLNQDAERFYQLKGCEVLHLKDPQEIEADVLIATDRWTVFPVAAAEKVLKKFYFVQDYEPLFYEAGSISVMVDYTYRLGLHPITAGSWLKKQLKMRHNLNADSFELACDHDLYNADNRHEPDRPTVVFYARGNTARRCVELGILALEQLKLRMPEVEIILFGFDKKSLRLPFKAETHNIIPPNEIAKIYKRSTVGLSLSATNYSLIPNEMMACGLPVVELNTANNTISYPKGVVTFAEPYPDMIAASLHRLLTDARSLESGQRKAIQYAKKLSWKKSAEMVEKSILKNFAKLA